MNDKDIYIVTKEDFHTFLCELSKESDLFVPTRDKDFLSYKKFSPESKSEYIVDQIRSSEPIKSFLTGSRERVDKVPSSKIGTGQVLVGIKNCDITSLKIQDFVFKDTDPPDPFYIQKRKETVIISCDCNMLWESCFCVALDINPYPETGFDLNLSNNGDEFIVEVGSEKGMGLVKKHENLFSKADSDHLKKRSEERKSFKDRLNSQIQKKETPTRNDIIGSVNKSYDATDIWNHFTSTCIECGGCNHCCPACHCFFLSDQKKGELKARFKSWDACLYNRFAKVAGGANPRGHLFERLRNRFDKKFEFFQNVLGIFGCTGCGRCIEACPGKIDIREVLKRVIQGK